MKKTVDTLHIKDIWKWYTFKLLNANPNWVGVNHGRIINFYIYAKYIDTDGKHKLDEVLNFTRFSEVVNKLTYKAKEAVIQGELFKLGRLGTLATRRVERNHSKKSVNFERTNAQPKIWSEEKQKYVPSKIIYFTTDDWCRVGWHKLPRSVANVTMYEFKPTKDLRSGKGFNQMLIKALKDRPSLKYKYIYYPLKSKKTKHGVSTN